MDGLGGYIHGKVVDINDPLKSGRVLVRVEGLTDAAFLEEWAIPVGWPGGGGFQRGSRYPIELEANVVLLFEMGDLNSTPICMPGPYGAPDGIPDAPPMAREVVEAGEQDVNDIAIIWEDEYFRFYIVMDGTNDRRVVLVEKNTSSHIVMDATDGAQGKSCTISIQAMTSINIESKGTIKIDAPQVQIQGRTVQKKPGVTTI